MVVTARVVAKETVLSIAVTWMVIATARGVGKVPYVLLPVQMTHLHHSANSTVVHVIGERNVIHVQDSAGTVYCKTCIFRWKSNFGDGAC